MSISATLRRTLIAGLANRTAGAEAQNVMNVISSNVSAATFSIGTEDGSSGIVVTIQLKDEMGANVAAQRAVTVLVLNGAMTAFNTSDYTVESGTNGVIIQEVADQVIKGISTATGALDVKLTISGAATCRLAVELPGNKLGMSSIITHA